MIFLRKRSRVRLVFHGAEKTTAAMSDPEVSEWVQACAAAARSAR